MRVLTIVLLSTALTGCTLWESEGKKLLREKALTCFNQSNCNAAIFSNCFKSKSEPQFISNEQLDEFSINANVFGFLDSKKLKFWSYTYKNNSHLFCESQLANEHEAEEAESILHQFTKLVEDNI